MISAFDLFKIGIGPSSSHTVGPMRAARTFARGLAADGLLPQVVVVRAELFGSLGATGHGHGSDKAVLLGLAGEEPETVDTDTADERAAQMRQSGRVPVAGGAPVAVEVTLHRRRTLPFHPNGMTFTAVDG
ncbi:MAG TPA: serine dehydratase beta chain, partial [Rugosimonospora sp.]|nr:serine dehydratase beta chain [Rugosimonospora sp.]